MKLRLGKFTLTLAIQVRFWLPYFARQIKRGGGSLKGEDRIPESGVNKYTCCSGALQKVFQGEWDWLESFQTWIRVHVWTTNSPLGRYRYNSSPALWRKWISVCERTSECTTYSLSVLKPCSLYCSSCFIQARSRFSLFTWDTEMRDKRTNTGENSGYTASLFKLSYEKHSSFLKQFLAQ